MLETVELMDSMRKRLRNVKEDSKRGPLTSMKWSWTERYSTCQVLEGKKMTFLLIGKPWTEF